MAVLSMIVHSGAAKSIIQPVHGLRGESNDQAYATFSLSGFIAECVYTAFQVRVSGFMISSLHDIYAVMILSFFFFFAGL